MQLDDVVYEAQAQNLIPRAIDYSAAVPDYFFRFHNGYTLEPDVHFFSVDNTRCDGIPDFEDGDLQVGLTIPTGLNFSGTASLYVEQSNQIRLLVDERTNPPAGQTIFLGGSILHATVSDPVRWYVVLQGPAGPGVQENQAVLANTDRAPWVFNCD